MPRSGRTCSDAGVSKGGQGNKHKKILELPLTKVARWAVGPVVSICVGVPTGRLVDAWRAARVLSLGLVALAAGADVLSMLPTMFGLAGYIAAIAILTPGYQIFQSANNTMAMAEVPADQRGAVSGLLGLSRNIGLISGASVMGAVFSLGASTIGAAAPGAVTDGLRLTLPVAGV